jgi:hypothetical protein
MVELVKYAAAIAVVATLISESAILAPVRERLGLRLLYCPVCLGFWLGLPIVFTDDSLTYLASVCVSHVFMLITLRVYAELDKLTPQ